MTKQRRKLTDDELLELFDSGSDEIDDYIDWDTMIVVTSDMTVEEMQAKQDAAKRAARAIKA
jgi:hypothetical protein